MSRCGPGSGRSHIRARGGWRQGFDENRHVGRRRPRSGGFFWRFGIFPEVLASAVRSRGVATFATEGAAAGGEGVGVGGGVLVAGWWFLC